jgi:hypothetical protein
MLGNFRLGQIEHALKVTDAERPMRQEVDDPEPGCIAEALVDLDEFHGAEYIRKFEY